MGRQRTTFFENKSVLVKAIIYLRQRHYRMGMDEIISNLKQKIKQKP